MSTTFRANSHDERDQIVAALQTYAADPASNPVALATSTQVLGEPSREYVDSRTAYRQASGVAAEASRQADGGDGTFDRTGRFWVRTQRDKDDRSRAGELTPLLRGMPIGELFNKPYRQELTLSGDLFEQLASRPDLQGDPAALAEFKAARAALEPLVTADEAATRAKLQAGARLAAATVEFDRAYGKLVRAFRSLLGDEGTAAVLPRFRRQDPSEPSSSSTPS